MFEGECRSVLLSSEVPEAGSLGPARRGTAARQLLSAEQLPLAQALGTQLTSFCGRTSPRDDYR
jgi:hypothetical protein